MATLEAWFIENAGKLTNVSLLAFFVLAFLRGAIVPGVLYRSAKAETQAWAERCDRFSVIAEQALHTLVQRGVKTTNSTLGLTSVNADSPPR